MEGGLELIILYFLASSALAMLGSYWIDILYLMPTAPITFPDKVQGDHLYRKIFMTAFLFATFLYCREELSLLAAYKLTATFFLLLITVTDFEQYIIFDKVLFPFAIIGIFFTILLELPLLNHLLASMLGGAVFFALMIISKNGIGGGDVKLVAALGLWIGCDGLLSVVLAGTILGGLSAIVLILTGLKSRKEFFAYGPYFCITAGIQIFSDKFSLISLG